MVLFISMLAIQACSEASRYQHSAVVTASAYNSLAEQTTPEDQDLAAWGERLEPGMKAIAVSRDLIELGLTNGVEVEIEGLKETFVVKDKINARWSQKIDIYMGEDVEAAKDWGKREVTIYWN